MKQGTVSVIIGCHSPIHSVIVILAWCRLYGRWPRLWQIVCIFLHDIGHWGRDYLDDYDAKKDHWKLGAEIGRRLFGPKAYAFLAGHCSHSGKPRSLLYRPDKFSWLVAPTWWLRMNIIAEPKLSMGYRPKESIARFRAQVAESIYSGAYRSTHQMFLERCNDLEPQKR